MAGAQLIYATVGFGAGMFSIALLALILPDLAPSVACLLFLTFITEIAVLSRHWRHARAKLLLGLVPTMAIGLYIGTHILANTNVANLKRTLGAVVAIAGIFFLYQHLRRRPISASSKTPRRATALEQCTLPCQQSASAEHNEQNCSGTTEPDSNPTPPKSSRAAWISVPVGLLSGLLGGIFGTGGPPVIIYLAGFGLDKGAFRATLLWFFLIMSFIRGGTYLHAGLLNWQIIHASLWLLPPSIVGTLAGLALHHRLTERRFALLVCILLTLLGTLLLSGAGK